METKASELLDFLANYSSHIKPIICEVCSYNGKPQTDGRCPECGAIAGIAPYIEPNPYDRPSKSKEESAGEMAHIISDSIESEMGDWSSII